MSDTLTRDQVLAQVALLHEEDFHGCAMKWTETDAALRADIESRDRTIAAMASKAMRLVPGCQDVDAAWGTLAALQAELKASTVHLVGRDALITQLRAEVEELKRTIAAMKDDWNLKETP